MTLKTGKCQPDIKKVDCYAETDYMVCPIPWKYKKECYTNDYTLTEGAIESSAFTMNPFAKFNTAIDNKVDYEHDEESINTQSFIMSMTEDEFNIACEQRDCDPEPVKKCKVYATHCLTIHPNTCLLKLKDPYCPKDCPPKKVVKQCDPCEDAKF